VIDVAITPPNIRADNAPLKVKVPAPTVPHLTLKVVELVVPAVIKCERPE